MLQSKEKDNSLHPQMYLVNYTQVHIFQIFFHNDNIDAFIHNQAESEI